MSGLGSFIQGAFKGYEYGEQVKDRKTQRKRDEQRWEWEKDNADWTGENRDRQREQWSRADADRDRMAEIYETTRDEFEDGQQPPAGAGSAPAPGQVQVPGQVLRDTAPGRGITEDPQAPPTRPQARPRSIVPQPVVSSEGPGQPTPPGNPGQPMQSPQAPQAPASVEGDGRAFDPMRSKVIPDQLPQPGRSVRAQPGATVPGDQPPASFVNNPRVQQTVERDGVAVADLWASMRPQDKQMFIEMDGQPTPVPPQVRPQQPARSVQGAGQNVQQPQQPDAFGGPAYAARAEQGNMVPPRGPRQDMPATNMAAEGAPRQDPPRKPGAPGAAPVVGNIDVRSATTEELDAQATQNPPDQGGAPSVEAAGTAMQETAAASKGVVGPGTGKVNPRDEKRAADSFMEYYAANAVPKIVDYYLSQGNVEKATAFQEWADSQKVKGQMESWSKAIWAITNGDESRFIDHMADTYNAIDDGYSIDRKQTKLKRDEQGNIVGGQLAVVNDETGEVNIQQFDDQQDIIEMAVYTMAPEQTFEYLWGLSQQAREMRIESAGENRITRKEMVDMIADEADSIRSAQENILDPNARLTEAQIEEQATGNVYRRLGINTGASTGQAGAGGVQEPPRY